MDVSYYEAVGGADALTRLADAFYRRVFADPVLLPLFSAPGAPEHAERLALWFGEILDGPPEYTRRRGGFSVMINAHRGRQISEEQRGQWVAHIMSAYDEVGLPATLRETFVAYVEMGSRFARQDSHRYPYPGQYLQPED